MQKAVFKNIQNELIRYLSLANSEIRIAVSWFTNRTLFDVLIAKLTENISVSLIITSDEANFLETGLDFKRFIEIGGKLYIQDNNKLMHHKFCIIDDAILVNGSYNWTINAEKNNAENIIIHENEENVVNLFNLEFNKIIQSFGVRINSIPILNTIPNDRNGGYGNTQYISYADEQEIDIKHTNNDDFERSYIYIEEIGRMQTISGKKFIPLKVYKRNGVMITRALYFAWENEYELNEIELLTKDDILSEGIFYGRAIKNLFPNFYFQVSKEMGLNWDLRTYKTDNLVIINVPIQKGDTYAGGLVNLGYDNFSLDIYVDIIEPLFKIGQQNFALNDLDAAINDFVRVLELAPNHVPSLYHMCYSLCRLNRDKEALPFADRLVKKVPDWDSYNLRKLIKESLGDHKGSKADEEAACESGKDPCF